MITFFFFSQQTNKFVCLSTLYKTIKYTYMQVLLCSSVKLFKKIFVIVVPFTLWISLSRLLDIKL